MVFLYVTDKHFSLQTIELSNIDKIFIEQSYKYLQKFPFKWNFFVNKIINNPRIIFFRDTTVILNINLIEFKKLEIVFEILRIYLKYNVIRKIIYKKEFLIIHFKDLFHMHLFTNKGFLISISLYYYLLKGNNQEMEIYLGGILAIGSTKKIVQLIVKKNNKYYLFDASNDLRYHLNEKFIKIHLYENLVENLIIDEDVIKFKITYSPSNYQEKLEKILK